VEPILRPEIRLAQDWMFPLFLFSLVAIAFVRFSFPYKLPRLVYSMFNIRIFRQMMREELRLSRENILMNAVFFLHAALFLYFVAVSFFTKELPFTGVGLYALLFVSVAATYGLKTLSIGAVRFIADGDFTLDEYRYATFVSNRFIVLFLIPLNALIAYCDLTRSLYFIIAVAVLIAATFSYRLIRSSVTALSTGVSLFYIFFYICTLEMVPLLVGYKLLMR
jgi:hypothetical protein